MDARELYVLLDEEVSYKTKLNREQLEHIQSFDLKESIAPGIHTFVSNPIIYIPLYLKNVGKGPAVAVRVGVNPKGSDWSGVKYWTLMPSDYFYLGIYADTAKDAAFSLNSQRPKKWILKKGEGLNGHPTASRDGDG